MKISFLQNGGIFILIGLAIAALWAVNSWRDRRSDQAETVAALAQAFTFIC